MITVTTEVLRDHSAEKLTEEILDACPELLGPRRADGYRDAVDDFWITIESGVMTIAVPTEEIAAKVRAVIASHKPGDSRAEKARKEKREMASRLLASRGKSPSKEEWNLLLDHLGIR